MPSFDIASKVDLQTLDNAVNTVKKEISNRFDFKNSPVEINLNKKDFIVSLEVESDMKMKQVIDVLISRSMKATSPELSLMPTTRSISARRRIVSTSSGVANIGIL